MLVKRFMKDWSEIDIIEQQGAFDMLVNQLNKDFAASALKNEVTFSSRDLKKLLHEMEHALKEIYSKDWAGLQRLFYRVDLTRAQTDLVFEKNAREIPGILAGLILLREIQKVKIRISH